MKYISQHDVVTHNLSKTKWDALWHSAIYFTSFFKKCWSWATKVISVTTCSLKNTVPRNQRMLCALLLESPQLLGLNGLFLKLVLATPSTLPLLLYQGGFSGGPMVKNLPCNAKDTGPAPGSGRSHMLQGDWAHGSPLWLHSGAHTPHLLKLACPRACALQWERTLQWEAHALQLESSLCSLLKKAWEQQ